MQQGKSSQNAAQSQNTFIEMEQRLLKHWYESGIHEEYLHKNDGSSKRFSFMDGPITANNPMGVHHAWGRSYKDMFQKFHNLLGHKQRFQNGFDCQGLWVEVEVEKELGLATKKDIENLVPGDKTASIAKFVQLCKERVMKYAGVQTQQSQRLGYFMDWDNSYYTMSSHNNFMIWHFLKTCHDNGWIYKGHDSVPWCPRCGTAISQHEILTEDYSEIQHETVFFKLILIDEDFGTGTETSLLAWTTTPWTIPGNVALAVNKEVEYVLISLSGTGTQMVLAESRIKDTIKESYEVLQKFKGDRLFGLRYEAPFDNLPRVKAARDENPETFHTVVDGTEIVSDTEGTGVLHVAPGQGQEDFKLGKSEMLSIIELIDEDATYYDGLNDLSGQNAKEKPGIIFKHLKSLKDGAFLYKTWSYKHRYPRCWRCKTELVWRVVDEWYIAMDRPSTKAGVEDKRTLRERMISVAKQITWIPKFGLDRELDWLNNMHDWLISKKRYWGLTLPIWISDDGTEFEVIGSEEELKERAIDGWDSYEGHTPHRPYVDSIKIESKKTGKIMHRIPDVGNPWLDAGIVPFSTVTDPETGRPSYTFNKEHFAEWFPIDFITESFPGQFKNWFYAMIAMSTVLEDTNPYKTVLGFATLKAEDGRAMHKSWGNSIEFNEGADSIGVDVMRWMYSRQNPESDMLFGYNKANEVRRQFYLMLWNVYKFLLDYSALDGIDVRSLEEKEPGDVHVLDRWIIARLRLLVEHSHTSLMSYNPRSYAQEVEEFVSDLSTWYLRRSRNRVGLHSTEEQDKQSFYCTLHYTLRTLVVILSPVLPYITEEIYTNLTSQRSVHLSSWPDLTIQPSDQKRIHDMVHVREIVEAGHRMRKEQKMKVRQPLAQIVVTLPEKGYFQSNADLERYQELIAEELNVKSVQFKESNVDDISVQLDTNLTDELIMEGKARDLIRQIQTERKKLGLSLEQSIDLVIPKEYVDFTEMISRSVLTTSITTGEELRVSLP